MHLHIAKIILGAICLSSLVAHAEPQGWDFVQAVGGIALGTPKQVEGRWFLPVLVDVSGVEKVTTQPTAMNSALVCALTRAAIESNKISLTIVTALTKKNTTSRCPSAELGALKPGKYSVFYRGQDEEPHPLGEVAIGL
jgi:hypothetical protein